MSPWALYLLGVATVPVIAGIWLAIKVATNSDYECACTHCGKLLGVEGKTWAIVSSIRWKAHYLRYWYRTRPEWTCQPGSR